MKKNIFKLGVVFLIVTAISCYSKLETTDRVELESGSLSNIRYLELNDDGKIYYSDGESTYILDGKRKDKKDFNILSKIKKEKYGYIVKNLAGKVGIFNEEFKSVIAFNYDRIVNLGKTDYIMGENDGKKYIINIYDYNMLGPYDEIGLTGDGKVIRTVLKGKTKYLDEKGKEIPALEDREIFFWRDNIAVVKENNKYGLVDLNTGKVVESTNSEIYFSKDNVLRKKDETYYLNDKKIDIGRVYPSMNDVVIYDKNEKFALFNLKNLKHSLETYDEIMFRYENYLIVGRDGKYGIINKYDEKAPEFKYLYVTPVGKDSFVGGSSEETGLVALIVGDKQVTEEKYDAIYSLVKGYFIGERGGNLFLLDSKGAEIMGVERENIIYYNNDVLVVKDKEKLIIHKLKRS